MEILNTEVDAMETEGAKDGDTQSAVPPVTHSDTPQTTWSRPQVPPVNKQSR